MTFRLALSGAQQAKLLLVAALVIGALSTVAGRGTMAFFTTSINSGGNAFTAGTLHLEAADVNETANRTSVTSSITFSNMKPGDVVYAPVELDNTGSLDMNYGLSYTTAVASGGDQNLADGLVLAINASGAGTGTRAAIVDDAANACSAVTFGDAGVWADVVRASSVMHAAGQTILTVGSAPSAAGRPLVHNTGKETLCLEIGLPSSVDNTYNNEVDGATNTTVTFTFAGLVADAPVTRGAGE